MSSLIPADLDAAFSQFSLFDEPSSGARPAPETLPKQSQRGRSYDIPVLRYIGWNRFVTAHQVIYRFWVYDGKGPRYGFRLLKDLAGRGLITTDHLDPEKGRASRQVLSLTDAGWEYIGSPRKKEKRTSDPGSLREYRLQFADMMLEREADGWTLVRDSKKFERMRRWSLRQYRSRILTDTERMHRDQVEKAPPVAVRAAMLIHRASGEPRLVLPVRRGVSYRSTIAKLPVLPLFLGVGIEVVSPDIELGKRATKHLKEWAERNNMVVEVHQSPHFRSRHHPENAAIPETGRYQRNGVSSPCSLI